METRKQKIKIPSSEIERDVYVAFDGKEFSYASDCYKHELDLKIKEIKQVEISCLYPGYSTFYFIDSEENLEFLCFNFGNNQRKTSGGVSLKVGDWVSFYYDYNPNGADDYWITTLDEIKTQFSKFDN